MDPGTSRGGMRVMQSVTASPQEVQQMAGEESAQRPFGLHQLVGALKSVGSTSGEPEETEAALDSLTACAAIQAAAEDTCSIMEGAERGVRTKGTRRDRLNDLASAKSAGQSGFATCRGGLHREADKRVERRIARGSECGLSAEMQDFSGEVGRAVGRDGVEKDGREVGELAAAEGAVGGGRAR